MPPKTPGQFRRICPVLIVADAETAAVYYRDKFAFEITQSEGAEFSIVSHDDCRIFLKRGSPDRSPQRNRDRCDDHEFYDLFVHFQSMAAFDDYRGLLLATKPDGLTDVSEWSGMKVFSANDLDGYKISFARGI